MSFWDRFWRFPRIRRKPLSRRETEVLRYMVQGCLNKEIAAQLGIGYQTVKNHVEHIYRKLGVHNRVQATTYAIREGWF